MKRCFGYTRVSTKKQEEKGVSLQEQRDAILRYAEKHSIQIAEWFTEKETAAKAGRPVFNDMLKRLKRGEASGLIVHAIDRSARNLRDWVVVSDLPDQGIEVHIAREHIDFSSRGGRLTADMLAVVASDFIRNHRIEIKKGQLGRLKQGHYPFRAPVGYLNNGQGELKTPCPKKSPLITEMFERYASGQHSLRSLHAFIKRRGLTNRSGNPITLHGVETILKNPFYAGVIEIKRTGETFKGVHKPIVSVSLFRRAEKLRLGRSGVKLTRHNHLYQGLFKCGICAGSMTPERQKGHVYYRCQRSSCPTKTIREELLSSQIHKTLSSLQFSEADATKLKRRWNAYKSQADISSKGARLKESRKHLSSKLDRAADLLLEGCLDNETYQVKRRAIQLELSEVEQAIQRLPDISAIERHNAKFTELMISLTELYISLERSEKHVLLENIFSNRAVVGKKAILEPYSWVQQAKSTLPVPVCDPYRYKDRTIEASSELQKVMSLLAENDDLLDTLPSCYFLQEKSSPMASLVFECCRTVRCVYYAQFDDRIVRHY